MIAAVLSGVLVVAVLGSVRVRPDHRLRDGAPPARSFVRRPGRRWHRRAAPDTASVAGWCDGLAREIRGGSTLAAALRSVTPPAGSRLTEVSRRLDRGVPLREALNIAAAGADEQAALTVLAACADHGGPAAQPLDRVAATLRRRVADEAERAVHSAQARLSARVMTVLPTAVLVLLVLTSAPVRASIRTPLGSSTVVAGLVLNALGWWWMRRIVRGGAR